MGSQELAAIACHTCRSLDQLIWRLGPNPVAQSITLLSLVNLLSRTAAAAAADSRS
jgi:hypothetical protein